METRVKHDSIRSSRMRSVLCIMLSDGTSVETERCRTYSSGPRISVAYQDTKVQDRLCLGYRTQIVNNPVSTSCHALLTLKHVPSMQ